SFDTTVWVGGSFTTVNDGLARPYLAKVNYLNGNFIDGSVNANSYVYSLVTRGDSVFAGGQFTRFGLRTDYLASIQEGNGKASQAMPASNGVIRCIIPDGSGGWY